MNIGRDEYTYKESLPHRSKYGSWEEAARAVRCKHCGDTWLLHWQRHPVTLYCAHGALDAQFQPDVEPQVVENWINGQLVETDQWGRFPIGATKKRLKQMMMEVS